MEITLQHLNTGLLSLLTFWEAAKTVARMIPNNKGNEAIAKVEETVVQAVVKGKDLVSKVREKAPYFWAVVELAEKAGMIPDKAAKPLEFLKRLRAAIPDMTPEAEAEAQRIAASLSKATKPSS